MRVDKQFSGRKQSQSRSAPTLAGHLLCAHHLLLSLYSQGDETSLPPLGLDWGHQREFVYGTWQKSPRARLYLALRIMPSIFQPLLSCSVHLSQVARVQMDEGP